MDNNQAMTLQANVCVVSQPMDLREMGQIISDDLGRAEIGIFCMLRAGVGLLCFKELSEHGEWEQRLLELGGGKSPRTLRMYMQTARRMCEQRGVTAQEAWSEAVKIDASQISSLILEAAGQPQLLTAGTADQTTDQAQPFEPIFTQMLLDYLEERKTSKRPIATPNKPLTKQEKTEAAVAEAYRIINLTVDWLSDGTWGFLPDEELESAMASIRTVADKLRDEFRRRQAK